MRLKKVEINNFRRLANVCINFEPATFIIGPNNCGKSSIIAAIEALLSLKTEKVTPVDFREKPDGTREEEIEIVGYFGPISAEVANSRGFKGRVVNDIFVYKKTFLLGNSKPIIESLEYPYTIKSDFAEAKTGNQLIELGIHGDIVREVLGTDKLEKKFTKGWERSFPEVLDFDISVEPNWVKNPGGFPTIVTSKLPRVLRVPSITDVKEIESQDKKYKLGECLYLLFEDLISGHSVAVALQNDLDELASLMDPNEEESMTWVICQEVNKIIGEVFPGCAIEVVPSLDDVVGILKPKYDVTLSSNVKTPAAIQGTGLLRTAIFSMLRYHTKLKKERDLETRPVIVAFEEPELYMHPSAGNMLRDTIYSLGVSDQIICTTHSPWMIDLTKDPQSLVRVLIGEDDSVGVRDYPISTSLGRLPDEDKSRVKMLQIFDDEVSRVFFAEEVVVVEGDSDFLAIRATLNLLPDDIRKSILSRYQVVKARGKASIISLVKYLKDLGISPKVMFDRDRGKEGAERFNDPIMEVVGDTEKVALLEENLENALGYEPPTSDKPYTAYKKISEWSSLQDIPSAWLATLNKLFSLELTH